MLILDEPTNHLDLESREALEDALAAFPGSLLLVSHDRALLDAIGSRTIELYDHRLRSYVGGWPEYLRVRAEREAKPAPKRAAPKRAAAPKPQPRSAAADDKPKAAKRRPKASTGSGNGARLLESEIEVAEAALATIEDELSDPAAWATPEATTRSTERHEAAKALVAELYERYESVAG